MMSIILERYGVPLEKVAQASIARYTGSVLPFALRGMYVVPWSIFTILLPVQVAIGVTSQFSSTLLFSDITLDTIRGFPNDLVVSYDFSPELNVGGRTERRPDQGGTIKNRWSFSPTSFETFAEHAEPDKRVVADGVDDTGPVVRAFLPIDSEQTRSVIQEYRGTARLFDARVMCVRPGFTKFSIARDDMSGDGKLTQPMYKGSGFVQSKDIPNLYGIGGNATVEFQFACSLAPLGGWANPIQDPEATQKPYWEICTDSEGGDGTGSRRIPSLDPVFYQQNPDDGHFSLRFGRSYVLMNAMNPNLTNFPGIAPGSDSTVGGMEFEIPILNSSGNGPWLEFDSVLLKAENQTAASDLDGDIQLKIKATFCMEVFMPEVAPLLNFNITATSQANRVEPKFGWDLHRAAYDTSAARMQLGVRKEQLASPNSTAPLSNHDRGILAITPESFREDIVAVARNSPVNIDGQDALSRVDNDFVASVLPPNDEGSVGFIFCAACINDDLQEDRVAYRAAAQFFENLFDDVLDDTGSPAHAIQSVMTVRARMAYQKWVSAFNEKSTSSTTNFVLAPIPIRNAGYFVVVGVIATQVFLLTIVGVLFARTNFTMLNNAWQTIAQVSSAPDLADVVAQAGMMRDKEVRKYIKSGERHGLLGGWTNANERYTLKNGAFVPASSCEVRVKPASSTSLRWRP